MTTTTDDEDEFGPVVLRRYDVDLYSIQYIIARGNVIHVSVG
jgi:hypothetical protein